MNTMTDAKHIIDCDATPWMPTEKVLYRMHTYRHQKYGLFQWDPDRIILHLSESQKVGKTIRGTDLGSELFGKPVLNACVLDYLYSHPPLIPKEWWNKRVFFWGTLYCGMGGLWYVGCLHWVGCTHVQREVHALDCCQFEPGDPAVLRTS